ncbi:MAG TPA: hypothetical protein VK922_06740 [Gemmatimonadaceae bacterium]|nr:hypothetical protein [Gemmatimonadaceae bacterium]
MIKGWVPESVTGFVTLFPSHDAVASRTSVHPTQRVMGVPSEDGPNSGAEHGFVKGAFDVRFDTDDLAAPMISP